VTPNELRDLLRALPQRNVDGVLFHVKGKRQRSAGLSSAETATLFGNSGRNVAALRKQLLDEVCIDADNTTDIVCVDPGAGQYAVQLGADDRIDLVDFSKEHSSFLRDEDRCKPLRKTTASQYLRARRGECYWSSFAKALVMHGRRTIVLYGASYSRGTFKPIRALIRHGAYCIRLNEFRSSMFSSLSDSVLAKIETRRSIHLCQGCVRGFCQSNRVPVESVALVSSAMAAPRQPLDNDDDDNDDNHNNADAQGRGHYHNRRRQQHEPNDAGRPVYDNATRSRLIAAERERINDRRQHARGTGKLDVPPDIADGEVDFAVTSSLSGRRALSALARHSVQDVRDERCVRACALGCSDQCNHGMRAFDAVAAARAQRDVDISTLSTRTLRRRAWRATARNQSAPFAGATEAQERDRLARRVRHRHRSCYQCEKDFNGANIYRVECQRAIWRYKNDTSNVNGHIRVHRDISACVNFMRIFIGLVVCHKRPYPFWSFENSSPNDAASNDAHVQILQPAQQPAE